MSNTTSKKTVDDYKRKRCVWLLNDKQSAHLLIKKLTGRFPYLCVDASSKFISVK